MCVVPGIKAALEALEAGDAEALVVAKLDRLSRSMVVAEKIGEGSSRGRQGTPGPAGWPPVTTPELTLARTALGSGEFRTALYHLEEACRVTVAPRRRKELLDVYVPARQLSERSEGRTHSGSAQLIRKVEAGVRSFAPSA